jgi:CheY-like chemotaxis protein
MWLRPVDDPALVLARDVIGRQVEQLTRLVNDLMDISRITRGNIRLEREPVDLVAVVRRAIETQRPQLDGRRQQLSLKLPARPLVVEGDLTRLTEAVGNLLNNAIKYTDEGGRITLAVEDDGGRGMIRVRDSGMGIPPEMLSSVWEMFTQIDHTLHRSQGGLGIGLALVRELISMHGGEVEARSDGLGKGSEFTIRLPLREDLKVSDPTARPAMAPLPRCRVLVVDDNRDAAETLAVMLRLRGGEVEIAHDGAKALEAAERFRPDMVLLDIGMPGMDGHAVARALRAQPWGRRVVLVAQTGWGQEEDRRRSREAGFDAHLTKPVDQAALQQLFTMEAPTDEARAAQQVRTH